MMLSFALLTGAAQASTVHCGDTITQDTKLDNDLLGCPPPALTVAGDDVTLDLNGHVADGGITTSRSKQSFPPNTTVVVENGVIRNGGLNISSYENVTVRGLLTGSIRVLDSGTVVVEGNRTVKGGESAEMEFGEDASGFTRAGEAVRVTGNVITGGAEGVGFGRGTGSGFVADNLITGNEVGVDAGRGAPLTVVGNHIRANSFGGIGIGTASLIARDNVISDNGSYGVHLTFASAELTDNEISRNGGLGIELRDHVALNATRNIVTRNGADGILAGEAVGGSLADNRIDRNGNDGVRATASDPHLAISSNHVWFNRNLGIESVVGVTGGGNWAKHNGNPLQCVPSYLCSTTGNPKK